MYFKYLLFFFQTSQDTVIIIESHEEKEEGEKSPEIDHPFSHKGLESLLLPPKSVTLTPKVNC